MKPAYRTLPSEWLTVAEAAMFLGVSKVAVYKALNIGRLEFQVLQGRKCVERNDLASRFWGSSQRIADRPMHADLALMPTDAQLAAAMAPIDRWIESQNRGPDWDLVAHRLNNYLGSGWPAPPWDGDQVNTLSMAIELALEGAGG